MTLREALSKTEPIYGTTRARDGGEAVYVRADTKARLTAIGHQLGVSQRHLVDAALLIICERVEASTAPLERYEYHSRTTRRKGAE